MKTDIQKDIQSTIGQITHLNTVESHYTTTNAELEETYRQQEEIREQLIKESKDISKLEGLSTKSLFHKILGNKEEQLEKERQEYLELSLTLEGLEKSIELLEYESNLLQAKLKSKDDLEQKLEKLKLRREEEIIKHDPILRAKLLDLSNQLESCYVLQKEIEEALEVSQICHNLFNQIINQLSQVRNWGNWPRGGRNRGIHNQLARRSAIDRARNLSYQIKHHLHLLDKELSDLGQRLHVDIRPEELTNFSTFFFNNLITDWIMNQQLTQAIGSAQRTRDQIRDISTELTGQQHLTTQKIKNLIADRERLLLS